MGEAIPFIRMTSPLNRSYRPSAHFLLPYRFFVGSPFPLLCGLRPFLLRFVGSCSDTERITILSFILCYLSAVYCSAVPRSGSFLSGTAISLSDSPLLYLIRNYGIGIARGRQERGAAEANSRSVRCNSTSPHCNPRRSVSPRGMDEYGASTAIYCGSLQRGGFEMFAFLRQTTDSQAIIVFFKPRVMRMITVVRAQ